MDLTPAPPVSTIQHVLRVVLGAALVWAGLAHLFWSRTAFRAQVPGCGLPGVSTICEGVGGTVSDAVGGAVNSGFESVANAMGEAAETILREVTTAWTRIPTGNAVSGGSIDVLMTDLRPIAAGVAVFGLIFSADNSFYNTRRELMTPMVDHGVLAVEMEASALYTIAAGYRRKALAICTVSDHVVTGEETTAAEREQTFGAMVEIALAAALG